MRRRNSFHYGTTWRKVRRVVLDRDNYRCTIGLPGCGKVATQVDHVVPLAFGGAPYQLENLRAACKSCNVRRANTHRRKHSRRW
jgi:5-methylcytosine-specific restriction protein A